MQDGKKLDVIACSCRSEKTFRWRASQNRKFVLKDWAKCSRTSICVTERMFTGV